MIPAGVAAPSFAAEQHGAKEREERLDSVLRIGKTARLFIQTALA